MAIGSAGYQRVGASAAERPLRLVALTHGAPSAENREAVMRLVDGVSSARPSGDISITFVDAAHTDVATALAESVRDPEAVIVPLVLSAGFHVRTGLTRGIDRLSGAGATLADPLGPDERLIDVLEARLEPHLDDNVSIVLAAAGSNDPRAVRECFETARMLAARLGRQVTVGFIAAAIPRLPDAIEMVRAVHPRSTVVVSAYLLAPGTFYDAVQQAGADRVTAPLLLPGQSAPAPLVDLVLERSESRDDDWELED
ncbi:cobalamin biosynthesis protein CbiX [Agromyces protaetiae]|uniref:Cobalamin biosynthesis protein CbiX n=1 Tax=Agromyces protaetiae TaxID=2509455 RepID=A0A4P6FDH7_9MICO|nr:CbiX/SirB N-terminal domain-containing protein [Agromyces protaetiae]QAY73796.1 cobalamin biosynthesis protein CbiX [Agromyces protaetiae]